MCINYCLFVCFVNKTSDNKFNTQFLLFFGPGGLLLTNSTHQSPSHSCSSSEPPSCAALSPVLLEYQPHTCCKVTQTHTQRQCSCDLLSVFIDPTVSFLRPACPAYPACLSPWLSSGARTPCIFRSCVASRGSRGQSHLESLGPQAAMGRSFYLWKP